MILTNPEVYIFDEATSNVDVESEDSILEAIYNIAKEKTVVVISHRLANIKNADKIYVLDKGYIVESGNHESLMNNNSTYAKLYKNQENLENIYNEEVIEEVAISEQ
ncbi:multidrug resistance 1 domain protein [[Clostridium] sordellii ATCC 9714]|nr:multidrug resistance 1 domain protein [[Clostridium] sordellii ATCC 9714] [Paeniclostridium sordellii ATCC 9714]